MRNDPDVWAEEWLSLARSHIPAPHANSANSANSNTAAGPEHAETPKDRANGTIGTNGTASTDPLAALAADLAARADRAAEVVAGMEGDADERAAIAEHDGGLPRDWAEGFARLQRMEPPAGFSPRQWARLIDDAGLFLDQWAAKASALGWDTANVWGMHPTRPLARYDHVGLVGLLDGARVIAITADTATLRTVSGATNTTHRRSMAETVPVWDLPPPEPWCRRPTDAFDLRHHDFPEGAA